MEDYEHKTSRGYTLPKGDWLDEDIGRIRDGFNNIDEDIQKTEERFEGMLEKFSLEMQQKLEESIFMNGNLSLLALERTQKIKIGVMV